MRQYSCIFIVFLFALFSCKKSNHKTNLDNSEEKIISISKKSVPVYQRNYETLNIKGKVKSITCTNYQQFIPDSELKYFVTKQDYKFDKKGNVSEEMIYNEHDVLDQRKRYFYDDMGNCLKTESFDAKGKLDYSSTIILNEDGLFVSEEYIEQNMTKIYLRNYMTITDSLIIYHLIRRENREGRGIKIDSVLRAEKEYNNGNLIKETHYSNGRISSVEEFKYDPKGNMTLHSNTGSHLILWKFKYDENDRQINWYVQNEFNDMTREIKRTHDNEGNIVKEVSFVNGRLSEEESFINSYVYDKYHNWVKRSKCKLNGDKISILERDITYF